MRPTSSKLKRKEDRFALGSRPKYVRLALLSLVIALVMFSSPSCSADWPPYVDSIRGNFFNATRKYEDLAQILSASDWTRVCNGTGNVDIEAKHLGKAVEKITSPEAKRIREHLEATRIDCIYRLENGGVAFEPYYSRTDSNTFYEISLTHAGGDVDVDVNECTIARPESPSGYCVVNLKSKWRIEYSWRPFVR